MNRKIILLIATILFIFIFFTISFGQYRPSVFSIPAPDFSLYDINGKMFKLSNQKRNPVIMFFGTTWCPACRDEMPYYKALYDKYAKRGLKFLYIDINESAKRVARFAKENSFPYIVLLDSDGSVANSYNVTGVPTLFLIDKHGNIVGASHRTMDLPINKLFPAKK
ncbi:putative thioredoxin [hydrocarbon metagenome]|uniref:Putative thioredoxin n=1 Tax=hydrocarbon metagenome TaxID=938273 RepID=A0A0W8FPH1_9ZZZZ